MTQKNYNVLKDIVQGDKVKFKSTLTYSEFGCDEKYFKAHIQGKKMVVINNDHKFLSIADETGAKWSLSLSDVVAVIKKRM
jgi:hypothetical protein